MQRAAFLFFGALLCALSVCCQKKSSALEGAPPSGLAGRHNVLAHSNDGAAPTPLKPVEDQPKSSRRLLSGRVIETIEQKTGVSYVRLRLSDGGSEIWVALVGAQTTRGQHILVEEQATMNNFHSKSLNRNFDRLIFGELKSDSLLVGKITGKHLKGSSSSR
jgi:hypothetical protein